MEKYIEFRQGKIYWNEFAHNLKIVNLSEERKQKGIQVVHNQIMEKYEQKQYFDRLKAKEEELEKREKAVEQAERELQSKQQQDIEKSVTNAVDKAVNDIFKGLKN